MKEISTHREITSSIGCHNEREEPRQISISKSISKPSKMKPLSASSIEENGEMAKSPLAKPAASASTSAENIGRENRPRRQKKSAENRNQAHRNIRTAERNRRNLREIFLREGEKIGPPRWHISISIEIFIDNQNVEKKWRQSKKHRQ